MVIAFILDDHPLFSVSGKIQLFLNSYAVYEIFIAGLSLNFGENRHRVGIPSDKNLISLHYLVLRKDYH